MSGQHSVNAASNADAASSMTISTSEGSATWLESNTWERPDFSVEELVEARDALTHWLAGEGAVPDWPGLELFTPGLKLTARHPSIRLAFEAAADAADRARAARGS